MVNSINPELQPEPTITYVSGLHHPTQAGWNSESIKLINELDPTFLAIDGLAPDSEPWAIEAQARCFSNPNNTILAGEPVSYSLQAPGLPRPGEIVNSINKDMVKETDRTIPFLAAAMVGASAIAINSQRDRKMSRRAFLGLSAATLASTAGAAVVGGKSFGVQALLNKVTQQPTLVERELYQNTASLMDEFLYPTLKNQRWWIDGRTAIITSKCIDLQHKSVFQSSGAILMGAIHGLKGVEYIEDASIRTKDIAVFLENLKTGLDYYAEIVNTPIHNSQKTTLAEYLSSYKVHKTIGYKVVQSDMYYDDDIFNIAMEVLSK